MTPADVAAYVREYLDLTTQDVSNTLILQWCKEGQRQVRAARPRWRDLEASYELTTEQGTAVYDISTSIRTVQAVDTPDNGPLPIVDEAEAKARWWRGSSTEYQGSPEMVSRWEAGKLRLWPTPDADGYTLTIMGQRPVTALASVTSALDVPEDLVDAVIEWVMSKCYMQQDDPDMASVHRNLFQETTSRLADVDDDDSDGAPLVFGGGFGQGRRTVAWDEPRQPGLGEFGEFPS